jgi:hypothetical protein
MSIRIAKALCEILYYLFWEEENEEKKLSENRVCVLKIHGDYVKMILNSKFSIDKWNGGLKL